MDNCPQLIIKPVLSFHMAYFGALTLLITLIIVNAADFAVTIEFAARAMQILRATT